MSKQLTAAEMAELVTILLTNPEKMGALDTQSQFSSFMTAIAEVVADHCGGEVLYPAEMGGDVWYVGIHANDSLPSLERNVWSAYDPDGEL